MECCDACLRRCILLGVIAPAAEKSVADAAGRRARELLALGDAELAAAVFPSARRRAARRGPRGRARQAPRRDGRRRHLGGVPPRPRYPDQLRRRHASAGVAARPRRPGSADRARRRRRRRSSAPGAAAATAPRSPRRSAAQLAAAGLTVISGMAMGIDSRAHEGALDAGGRTVAVLGSGPDVPHPPSKRRLYERIAADGLVLSELPPGTRARSAGPSRPATGSWLALGADDGGGRGGRAVGLADHRRDGERPRSGCRGGTGPGGHAARGRHQRPARRRRRRHPRRSGRARRDARPGRPTARARGARADPRTGRSARARRTGPRDTRRDRSRVGDARGRSQRRTGRASS